MDDRAHIVAALFDKAFTWKTPKIQGFRVAAESYSSGKRLLNYKPDIFTGFLLICCARYRTDALANRAVALNTTKTVASFLCPHYSEKNSAEVLIE